MTNPEPWRVGEWDLHADLAKIDQQWAPIRRILEDPSLFDRNDPGVSGWSCGQQAGHMVLVAQTIADRVEGNLADPARHCDETTPEIALRVLGHGGFQRGSAEAPAEVRPEPLTRGDSLALMGPLVESWARIRARADELPDCTGRYPHFRLGYLTSKEWVRMWWVCATAK
jgi:hypothetical protein